MNPLLRHLVPQLIHYGDAIKIADGGTWKDLWLKTTLPGAMNGAVAYRSDATKITVTRSPDGEGTVTWAEIAEVIAAGLTPELAAEARDAGRRWRAFNDGAPIDGDTYSTCTARFRSIEHRIAAHGLDVLAQVDGQMSLFEAVAS